MAKYISRVRQLRIILKPAYHKEMEGRVITTPGTSVRFEDGVFETDDKEIIKALEADPGFNSDTKGAFTRVPENVADLAGARETRYEDLETRENRQADAAAEKEKDGKVIQGHEEGAKAEKGDGLDELKRDQLVELAEKEGLEPEAYKVGTKNSAIVEAIRAKRAEGNGAPQEGAPAF